MTAHRCRSGLLAATAALLLAPVPALAQSDVAPVPGGDNEPADVRVPQNVRDLVERIETDLDAWDVQGAQAALEELERSVGKDQPGLALMEAKVAFFEGRYADSVKLYSEGGAPEHEGGYRKLAEDALAQTRDDLVQKSEHFDLYYPPGKDAVLAPYALETLERAYAALTKDFDFTPPGRIRVEILPNDEALAKLSTLTIDQIRTTGTIAICKFNRLMVISPRALVHGYDWRDTLNHEFVHFVVSMKSRNTVPIWIHEGLAKYEETRWRDGGGTAETPFSESLLGQAVKHDKLITFEQMHPSMALLPSATDAATAFAEVFHAIEFLKSKGGTAMWNQIIANLKAGESYQDAVAHAYHAPFEKFVSDWKSYLGKLKYPTDVAEGPEHLKFKSAGQMKQDAVEATELTDFQDVKEPSARRFAHLGGLLFQRHHLTASLEEFGKAYAKGSDSVQLASKYGEALLLANQLDLARKVLAKSLEKHPRYELNELYLGEVLLKQGDAAGARDHFLVGIDTDPFDPRLHVGLAGAYGALKDAQGVSRANQAVAILQEQAAPRGPGQPPASLDARAQVMLASHPFASVLVDGKPLGRTTPTVLSLEPGKHHLVLTNEERGLKKELDLEVKAGEQKELRIELAEGADTEPLTR